MRSQIGLRAFITFLATILSVDLGFPTVDWQFIQNLKSSSAIQNSQALAQTPAEREAEADRLLEQGIEQQKKGQFRAALQSGQEALKIYREIADRKGEGAVLNNLGEAYRSLGEYTRAIEFYQQSLAVDRSLGNRKGESYVLNNLGIVHHHLGDYAKAIDYFEQRLTIAREIRDRSGEQGALGNIGIVFYSLGNYVKAIDFHRQSLAIARELGDRSGEGASLNNLGIAYDSLGDYPRAIEYYQQRLPLARELGERHAEGQVLGNLGVAYMDLRDYPKAIEYLQQRIAIAREIGDRLGEATALGNLGNAYTSLGDYAKAIDYQQQRIAIARQIGDIEGEGTALNNLGVALRRAGKLTEAEKTLSAGIQIWESLRQKLGNNDTYKVSVFEQQAKTYRLLQQVLIAQNKINEALEIAERGRARAFVELLMTRVASPNALTTITPPNIQKIQQIAKEQNATLVEYSIIVDSVEGKNREQIEESELYIWVVKPTGEVSFRSSNLKSLWQQQNTDLAKLVVNSRASIGVRGRGLSVVSKVDETSQAKQLQQLHQLLIQPITDLLPKEANARVVFIPQTSLFLVPFAALQDSSGKYLIEQHTILTAPSIQVLDLTRQQKQRVETRSLASRQNPNALVVGNPNMPSVSVKRGESPQKLSTLPGAEREALAIATLLNTKALIGNSANESAVVQQMSKAKMIHLATHGLLDDFQRSGVPGAIALAPSGQDDGLLTASEILNLKLNAELVVLSACDTGQGILTGDGVIGLSRSLITAGVPSVIVTLWAIPDNSSALLMSEFYRNLQQNPDKAQALRRAMLTTMKQYPDQPSAWAAYTLIGEAE
ncbi:CHAT domain-containing tetratricopeptide repeat protein [Coleofasciculus sp. FACHB-T130]|uniref:CHAT domain-containing protein n=1 Tax=Cyanophyceae TaxID=3028117 RepID=UPI0016897711|nr:CHAT domain-containing tetratricopeptide repeat protein [Coleofasciculus sp. FACHB-T130]MBD1877640.1 CHAT domain-containing protein [Coleofasciculus sp. FACHB-T130]